MMFTLQFYRILEKRVWPLKQISVWPIVPGLRNKNLVGDQSRAKMFDASRAAPIFLCEIKFLE